MPTLKQRVDHASITAVLLPLPQGKKRGRGVGFWGGHPVASVQSAGNAAPPFRWVAGKPQPVTFLDVKNVLPAGASASQLAGCWYTSKHDERALVWTRTADESVTGVELHPEGWQKSVARACGDGQQVGYVSQAFDLEIDGDTLCIIGTANQAVQSNGYEMDAGEEPVMWEMKLLVAEPAARRDIATARVPAAPAVEAVSDERKVERLAGDFAQAIVDDDYDAAHDLLAPWLQRQLSATELRAILEKQFLAESTPADFQVSGNDSTLAELREHYEEYHANDRTRTLASVESFGDWGPPSIYIADEITPANFRQWVSIDVTPDLDDESGLDYILRLWLIVADVNGTMKVGHLEPGD